MKFKVIGGKVQVPDEYLNFEAIYYDDNPEGQPTTSFPVPSGSVLTEVISRTVSAPEEFGAVVRVSIRAINSTGAPNDCFYNVSLDGTILRQHGFNIASGPFNGEGSLQAVVRELIPGDRVFTLNVQSEGGIGVIVEMTIELVRIINLKVN